MTGPFISQIAAVFRIELKKTFFSKRSVWIYLLALLPALLFYVNSIYAGREHARRAQIAAEHPIEKGSLMKLRTSSSIAETKRFFGEPYRKTHREIWYGNPPAKHERDVYFYTDGDDDVRFVFDNGIMQTRNRRQAQTLSNLMLVFATTFQLYFIRLAIFFGCAGVFTNLFRGEMIDKSLHYYLLAPVPRPVLVAGKYIAGISATAVIFAASTALQLFALLRGFDGASVQNYLHEGNGWHQIATYIGVTVLACIVYGSIFLAAGLVAKNPAIPAAVLLLWESVNAFIPGSLKMFSVVFYLQSLCPVDAMPDSSISPILLALLAPVERVATSTSVLALLGLTLAVMVCSSMKARQLEINYSAD